MKAHMNNEGRGRWGEGRGARKNIFLTQLQLKENAKKQKINKVLNLEWDKMSKDEQEQKSIDWKSVSKNTAGINEHRQHNEW